MTALNARQCTPCQGGIPPMEKEEAEKYLAETPGWILEDDGTRIKRTFKFDDYASTLDFVKQVADLAEQENHHPDIFFGYGVCEIEIQTHKIHGLHENDFILASKINQISQK